ncbi:MAG: hypothetical protein KJO08_09700 [Gammaproteobacteria bacterium]|nr:hypothetical protein [Gammaproteobacteria bacterium]NNJ84637.1 hypothetical protein [Gammaproteobacteria bacterium]
MGVPFQVPPDRPRALLLGGGLGIPPMIFLARWLMQKGERVSHATNPSLNNRQQPIDSHEDSDRRELVSAALGQETPFQATAHEPLLLMGSEIPFPFDLCSSRIPVSLPDGVTAAMAPMEALGIPSRLASGRGYPGSFQGFVTELAELWLRTQPSSTYREIALYACGPEPMLRATANLARRYDLPCQVCLEEFMACGVGACAGCVVPVTTPTGVAMKRVCVDGPVFHARDVFL